MDIFRSIVIAFNQTNQKKQTYFGMVENFGIVR